MCFPPSLLAEEPHDVCVPVPALQPLLCPQKHPLAGPCWAQSWGSHLWDGISPHEAQIHVSQLMEQGECAAPRTGGRRQLHPSIHGWLEFWNSGIQPGRGWGTAPWQAQPGQTGSRAAHPVPPLHVNNSFIPPLQSQQPQQLHTGKSLELSLYRRRKESGICSGQTSTGRELGRGSCPSAGQVCVRGGLAWLQTPLYPSGVGI